MSHSKFAQLPVLLLLLRYADAIITLKSQQQQLCSKTIQQLSRQTALAAGHPSALAITAAAVAAAAVAAAAAAAAAKALKIPLLHLSCTPPQDQNGAPQTHYPTGFFHKD
jgi:hypothetical protein